MLGNARGYYLRILLNCCCNLTTIIDYQETYIIVAGCNLY